MLGLRPDVFRARFDALGSIASDEAIQALGVVLRASRTSGRLWSTEMECTRSCGTVVWIRSGHRPIDLRREPLRPILNHALASTRSYAPDKGLRFSLTDDTQDAEIDVDPDRLGQILANPLSNAAKFSPEGGRIALSAIVTGAPPDLGQR